jgi:hypothetical protein
VIDTGREPVGESMSAQSSVVHSADLYAAVKPRLPSPAVRLGDFACELLAEEAARLGVSIEELASFSILYYLADLDSGRAARSGPPRAPSTQPLGEDLTCAEGERASARTKVFARRPIGCS